jgi:hypothetical protein
MVLKKLFLAATAATLVVVVIGSRVTAQRRGPAGPLVVNGATLIDGTGSAPVADSVIVIENNKITGIGPRGTVIPPQNARVIDAKGKFVIPGLIDGHTHWRSWTGELFLNNGITTIIDLGNPTDWILAVRDAEMAGRLRGPRIFTAAGGIELARAGRGGVGGLMGGGGTAPYMYPVDGPAQARMVARQLLGKGADVLKIFSDLTPEEFHAITDEAHKVDVPVLGHSNDLYASINGGMDGVTHLWGVSATLMSPANRKKYDEGRLASPYAWMEPDKIDPLISFLVQHGSYINPCLGNEHPGVLRQAHEFEQADYQLLIQPNLRYLPLDATLTSLTFFHKVRNYDRALGSFPYVELLAPSVVDEFRRGYKNAQEFTRRFAKAGGKIFAGTDAAGSASLPGLSLHQELELFVDAGLTPMQALMTATKIPAEMIRKDKRLGTLKADSLADLLILDADPLLDIRNTQKINTVIKNGEVVDRTYHRSYFTEFAELEGVGRSTSTAPRPVITEVTYRTMNQMSMVLHNASPFDLVVKGSFHITSVVLLEGRPLETTFVNAGELSARVPTERLTAAGTYAVTVETPWPGGGTSNVKTLTVK